MQTGQFQKRTILETFWDHAVKHDSPGMDCWEWMGATDNHDYGVLSVNGRLARAHRVAWELTHSEVIPPGLVIRHTCHNPWCVNPDHLLLGTQADNMQDRWERGPWKTRPGGPQTHCKRGHPLSGDNLYLSRNGARVCRQCRNERVREHYRRKRAEQSK